MDNREASLKLWVTMSRAHQAVHEALRRDMERRGLSMKEFAVLEVLLHKGRLPIGEIGDRVLLTSGSMTYVIDQLEEEGLIQRKPCPEDRRIIYVCLTDKGRALIEEIFPEHAALIERLMDGLSCEEKREAAALMKRLGLRAAELGSEVAVSADG